MRREWCLISHHIFMFEVVEENQKLVWIWKWSTCTGYDLHCCL